MEDKGNQQERKLSRLLRKETKTDAYNINNQHKTG